MQGVVWMGLIERYIFRRLLYSLLIISGALIVVVWVVRVIQEVDLVLSQGQGILVFLEIATYGVLPFVIPVLPVSLLIASLHTLSSLNQDSELVVLSSAGLSRGVILRPFLFVGLLCSIVTYILSLWLSPLSMQQMRSEVTQMRANLVSVVLREGEFYNLASGMTFHIASREPGGILRGIFILDERTDDSLTYLADEGTLREFDGDVFLVLSGGEVQRSDGSVVNFSSYTYNLSTLSPSRSGGRLGRREIPTWTLLTSPLDSSFHQDRPGYYRAELHSRLTSGLYPLGVILLIVSALGYPRSARQNPIATITTISSIVIFVRILGIVSENILHSDTSGTYIYVQWLIPSLSILVPSLVMFFGYALSLPRFMDRALLRLVLRAGRIGIG